MERVVQNRSATLTHTFTSNGVATDPSPDSATVTITRSDGTALVTAAAATEAGTGVVTYTLTPTQTALLDTLKVTWTATFSGLAQQYVDYVEVAGGVVFTIPDARATSGLNATLGDGTYRISTARIVEARTEVERALEHELGFAMVPRFTVESVDGDSGFAFMLSKPYVRAIRSVSVNGTALDTASLATVVFNPSGRLYYPTGWASGYGNVTVGYEHGMDTPPPRAKDVALALAKRALTGSPADDRATSMSTDEQVTNFYMPTNGEPFDVPAANRFVTTQSMRVGIA
jgi:hypothetical protein